MALLLADAAKMSTDMLKRGVIETIVLDSPILQRLPFMEVAGNSLKYNRELALPTVAFYAVGDPWTEDAPTFDQLTASLAIMGGDADVDHYIQQTRSNIQDIQQEVIALKAKAMRHTFENTFINGDLNDDPNAFDGINVLCTGDQAISMGEDGDDLSLAKLDELVDLVRGGKPDLLLMSRRTRRTLKNLMETLGIVEISQDQFGNIVQMYNGIPVAVNDWISDALTEGDNDDCSSIFALQMSEGAVCGLSNGGIQVEVIGQVQAANATRTRLRWYVSMASFSAVKLAKLTGVRIVPAI